MLKKKQRHTTSLILSSIILSFSLNANASSNLSDKINTNLNKGDLSKILPKNTPIKNNEALHFDDVKQKCHQSNQSLTESLKNDVSLRNTINTSEAILLGLSPIVALLGKASLNTDGTSSNNITQYTDNFSIGMLFLSGILQLFKNAVQLDSHIDKKQAAINEINLKMGETLAVIETLKNEFSLSASPVVFFEALKAIENRLKPEERTVFYTKEQYEFIYKRKKKFLELKESLSDIIKNLHETNDLNERKIKDILESFESSIESPNNTIFFENINQLSELINQKSKIDINEKVKNYLKEFDLIIKNSTQSNKNKAEAKVIIQGLPFDNQSKQSFLNSINKLNGFDNNDLNLLIDAREKFTKDIKNRELQYNTVLNKHINELNNLCDTENIRQRLLFQNITI